MFLDGFNNIIFKEGEIEFLLKKLSELKKNNYVFRGMSDENQFFPLIIRNELQKYEIELLEDLENKSQYLHNSTLYTDFLTTAQHYGLPTRLLDFSYNPYIALFFALYSDAVEGEYYYVLCCNLIDNVVFKTLPIIERISNTKTESFTSDLIDAYNYLSERDSSSIEDLYPAIYNRKYKGLNPDSKEKLNIIQKDLDHKLVFLETKMANIRIAMQEGLFLFTYTTDKAEYLNKLQKNTILLCIHKNLRTKLLDELNNIGITEEKIMPDMQSICISIANKYKSKFNQK